VQNAISKTSAGRRSTPAGELGDLMMTTSTTNTAQQASAETRATNGTGRGEPRSIEQSRERFERALRNREHPQDDDETPTDAPAGNIAALLGSAPPLRAVVTQAPPPAGHVETVSTGPRAAIEAALNANAGPAVTPIGGTDPAAVWEASIREPNSVAVDVRATRVEKSAFESHAPVTLTIGSSSVDASVLGRHVSRLNERLRKHAVGPMHARIKDYEGDAE
jgi:hypothetical protein